MICSYALLLRPPHRRQGPKISKENFGLLKFRFGIWGTWSQNRDWVWTQIGFLASWTSPNQKLSTRLLSWLRGKESACYCRRHGFDPWSGMIPQAVEQLSPCATTTEPVLWSLGTTVTDLTCRKHWSTRSRVLPNKKSHYSEERAHHNERAVPTCQTWEKPVQRQRPSTVKNERRMNEWMNTQKVELTN